MSTNHSSKSPHRPNHPYRPAMVGDVTLTFPQMLMELLEDTSHEDIVTWLPHGRAFVIYDKHAFLEHVVPRFFRKAPSKFLSFVRRLHRWGFVRIPVTNVCREESAAAAYQHAYFQRGQHRLLARMECNCPGVPPPPTSKISKVSSSSATTVRPAEWRDNSGVGGGAATAAGEPALSLFFPLTTSSAATRPSLPSSSLSSSLLPTPLHEQHQRNEQGSSGRAAATTGPLLLDSALLPPPTTTATTMAVLAAATAAASSTTGRTNGLLPQGPFWGTAANSVRQPHLDEKVCPLQPKTTR